MDFLKDGGSAELLEEMATEDSRYELIGRLASEDTLRDRVDNKLQADLPVRVAELQSMRAPPGGLLHSASDGNKQLSAACQLEEGLSNAEVQIDVSADLGMVIGLVLKKDGSWASEQQHVADLVAQFGQPRLHCRDNMPTNFENLRKEMPSTCFTTDFLHWFQRLNNSTRSFSAEHSRIASELRDACMVLLTQGALPEPPVASKEYYLAKLRSGDVKPGGKVMIVRGKGSEKPKFFTFGEQGDGATMPEALITQILSNGAFDAGFEHNLQRDWRPVEEMRSRLTVFKDALQLVQQQLPVVLRKASAPADARQPMLATDAASTGFLVAAMEKAHGEARSAAEAASSGAIDAAAVEAAATAAASAAAHVLALTLQEAGTSSGQHQLLRAAAGTEGASGTEGVACPSVAALRLAKSDERRTARTLIDTQPCYKPLKEALHAVGAYFNERDVLEHTCTTSTLPILELCLTKLQFLGRPSDVARHMYIGDDGRGFPRYRRIDGSNLCETVGGELEKPLSANGGYSEKKWEATMHGKAARINERARLALHGGKSAGCYDTDLMRKHNELMRSNGQPLPHPTLEPLLPPHLRSTQLHCAAYLREDQRKIAAAAAAVHLPSPPALALPPPPPLFDGNGDGFASAVDIDDITMCASCDAALDAHMEARAQTPSLAACSSSGAENPSSDTQPLPLMSVAEAAAAAKRARPSEAAGEASTSDSALGGYSAGDLGRKPDGRPPAKVVKPQPKAGELDIQGILPHHQTCGYQLERPRENTL